MGRLRVYRRRLRRAASTVTDAVAGLDTTAVAPVPADPAGPLCGYEPCYWFAVPRGLRGYRWDRPGSFLDLGCGKGRALYVAGWYPFRAVIGVELDAGLARVARRNLAVARGPRRAGRAEVVHGDAREVGLPADLRVVFLFNPFLGTVFRTVAERLAAHATAHGTGLRVVYANPVEAAALDAAGFARRYANGHCAVYEFTG